MPDAIGRELGRRLEARYEVVYHEWTDIGAIEPEPGDILVGHPHPDPRTVFRRSLERSGWRRRLMLSPFNHGDLRQIAFLDPILPSVDLYLAITGPYWFRTLGASKVAHWAPKMVHLDMAIDRANFPTIKTRFGEPGHRRILYIGRHGRGKGVEYLSQIAQRMGGDGFGWMGPVTAPLPGLRPLGYVDYAKEPGKELVRGFDFMLTVGDADANPTTILEAMSWGLLPVCTPTSGYAGIPSIPNVPLGRPDEVVAIMWRLDAAPEAELLAMQAENWRLLDEHYNWDRFAAQVIEAIESDESPALAPEGPGRRLFLRYQELTSPLGRQAWSRPGRAVRRVGKLFGRARRRLGRETVAGTKGR